MNLPRELFQGGDGHQRAGPDGSGGAAGVAGDRGARSADTRLIPSEMATDAYLRPGSSRTWLSKTFLKASKRWTIQS